MQLTSSRFKQTAHVKLADVKLQAALHTEMTATGDTEPTKLDMTTHTRIQPL